MTSSKPLLGNVRSACIIIYSSCFIVYRDTCLFLQYSISSSFNSHRTVLHWTLNPDVTFRNKTLVYLVNNIFEASSLISERFSRTTTREFVPDETRYVGIRNGIVNRSRENIFSHKLTYGDDLLSVRHRAVMLNNALREMFFIRTNYPYQEENRKENRAYRSMCGGEEYEISLYQDFCAIGYYGLCDAFEVDLPDTLAITIREER